ncbi:alpha-(1,3)-fucosyltransferase 7-like [Lytechinus pictus]|uniref:alpha-(1,3)-fucosyltransferase 7-like n=1 Tax=Lytechinus pictus TaxID=7653 RepID=UPI0030BA03B3
MHFWIRRVIKASKMVSRKNSKVIKTVFFFLAGLLSVGILNGLVETLPSFEYSSQTRALRIIQAEGGDPHLEERHGRSPRDLSSDVVVSGRRTSDGQKVTADQTPRCVKKVLIFGSMIRMAWIPELNHFKALLETSKLDGYESDVNCSSPGYKCDIKLSLGAAREDLVGKDAVIFGMVSTIWITKNLLHNVLKHKPEPGQTWIFYSTETPYRVKKWAGSDDLALFKYHVLMTYNRASDVYVPFGYYRPFSKPKDGPTDTRFLRDDFYTNRTGILSWVATNCQDVFWPRMQFIDKLRQEISLDDYGACGHKECLPRRSTHCNELFASYKFYLSIPNSECRDYITEKFWMISLKYGTVPLVLGTVKEDYEPVAPPNSFVHFGDFKSIKAVADHLKKVDNNDTLYRQYHEWRRHGEVITPFPYRPESLCRTLPHIYPRPESEIKLIGNSTWYKDCRTAPSEMDVNPHFETIGNWTPWKLFG